MSEQTMEAQNEWTEAEIREAVAGAVTALDGSWSADWLDRLRGAVEYLAAQEPEPGAKPDVVWWPCPECGHHIEVRTWAGDPSGRDTAIENLSPEVAGALAGHTERCPKCQRYSSLRVEVRVSAHLRRTSEPVPADLAWAARATPGGVS